LAFQRVAGNLLDNALRYGGGQVPSVEFDADALVVRVLDWGAGIPEGEREKVFRPFHRLDPSRSNATGGSGLGLAIVRQLADANGWRVWLETRPGGGTVASIQLQVHEPILADCQPSTCFSS
jgi:two-component system osmolarity sensor histidine kinase EnvZ